eukprot:1060001-Pelagomonas_calceolata.AAC.1
MAPFLTFMMRVANKEKKVSASQEAVFRLQGGGSSPYINLGKEGMLAPKGPQNLFPPGGHWGPPSCYGALANLKREEGDSKEKVPGSNPCGR